MTKKYFTELANYNNWSDKIIIEWLKQINEEQWEQPITSSFSSVKQTAVHIVSAKKVWIDFWTKVPDPVYLSTEFNGTKNELIAIWQKASDDLQYFIEKYPEENYQQLIHVLYPNGKEAKMIFWQTFPHFINHATYHRGQLVTLLRQAGFTKFSNTDLFTYFMLQQ
ncbi:MAG: DUF1572 domain-containing protein [Flavobacterium sp.]|nr:MAG: DUF1572 domain-containing protein [Flavobacterium sp.]